LDQWRYQVTPLAKLLEAALFASAHPVPLSDLEAMVTDDETSSDDVVAALNEIKLHYDDGEHGIELMEVAGGWQILTRPEFTEVIEAFARQTNGGLMILPDVSTANYRDLIIELAARHRLPAVYPYRYFALSGGLLSYGPDLADVYRRAASYVDRILKGAAPGDLPVQAPSKFEMVINLKTANAMGLTIPPLVLGRADEVIE